MPIFTGAIQKKPWSKLFVLAARPYTQLLPGRAGKILGNIGNISINKQKQAIGLFFGISRAVGLGFDLRRQGKESLTFYIKFRFINIFQEGQSYFSRRIMSIF